ncbi:MaoC family dehydratase [Paenibacillus hemerocallicola]|jgi:acyl dehydratase|uniref:MaoC family dehydratase n=1 Tax=Paenibacillus hemerocallicola TaxID=1172614 RepID=A0A5C4T0P9_9BACL|nr:MaoC family dehydratase [Paenibacillus hemerocallicola]TNJ61617.1 MaoC family dehydratase [Paenibacillus hemerocallicola]
MAEIHTPYGRVFEDFEVGDVIRHWPGRTITQADDLLFSLLSLNQHPLHIDAHYASQTSFGQNVVNGTLVFSISVGLTVNDISGAAIANLEYENVAHLLPTFHGDTLYARTEILSKTESKSKEDRGVVYVETIASNQRNEDVLRFRRRLMVPKRAFAIRPHTHTRPK